MIRKYDLPVARVLFAHVLFSLDIPQAFSVRSSFGDPKNADRYGLYMTRPTALESNSNFIATPNR